MVGGAADRGPGDLRRPADLRESRQAREDHVVDVAQIAAADLILVSHEHNDHFDVAALKLAADVDSPVLTVGFVRSTLAHARILFKADRVLSLLGDPPDGSDLAALDERCIAVTPLKLDLTDEPTVTKFAKLFE